MTPFEFRRQIYHAIFYDITLLLCENRVILTTDVLLQYTRITEERQTTTYRDN